jgi:hypothetical protein
VPRVSTTNDQVVEATVSGPDGANRLIACTGTAGIFSSVSSQQQKTETFTFLVGPVLARRQFHAAAGSGAVTGINVAVQALPINYTCELRSVEADWDDESGQVEMRFEVSLSMFQGTGSIQATSLTYSATILAESAP